MNMYDFKVLPCCWNIKIIVKVWTESLHGFIYNLSTETHDLQQYFRHSYWPSSESGVLKYQITVADKKGHKVSSFSEGQTHMFWLPVNPVSFVYRLGMNTAASRVFYASVHNVYYEKLDL